MEFHMTYSFTEKKRIRKSFAKRANVLDVPFLLATQLLFREGLRDKGICSGRIVGNRCEP